LHYFLKTGNIKDENYIKTMAWINTTANTVYKKLLYLA
jgi:hypothetical protein